MNLKKAKAFISNNLKVLFLSIAIGLFACAISIFAFSSPGANQPPNGNPIFWLLSGTSMYYTAGNVGIGTASPAATLDVGGTGSQKMPVGTTAQRPSSPVTGMMRFNTDNNNLEIYNGTKWSVFWGECAAAGGIITKANGYCVHVFNASGAFQPTFTGNVEVLVVAGGGGGAGDWSGGGGGGGVVYNSTVGVSVGAPITVTVGAGGAAGNTSVKGSNGGNSAFGSVIAYGGGGGGADSGGDDGLAGGSGGGAAIDGVGGSGTAGQGYAGANGNRGNALQGGGGGGAGQVGQGQAGGNGLQYSISGIATYYGGGGGGARNGSTAPGGLGGGGTGANAAAGGSAGVANTGGGGGGQNSTGFPGGSGIVIVRYVP